MPCVTRSPRPRISMFENQSGPERTYEHVMGITVWKRTFSRISTLKEVPPRYLILRIFQGPPRYCTYSYHSVSSWCTEILQHRTPTVRKDLFSTWYYYCTKYYHHCGFISSIIFALRKCVLDVSFRYKSNYWSTLFVGWWRYVGSGCASALIYNRDDANKLFRASCGGLGDDHR